MAITSRALAFASRWFDPAIVDRVFEPLIADWQRELQDADGVARFAVRIRGAWALLVCLIVASPTILHAAWPAGTLRRSITRVTIWTMAVSAVMLIPFIYDLAGKLDIGVSIYLLLLLLPSTIAVAFPVATATVVDVIRTAREPVREERVAAVKFAVVAVLLMVVLVGWGFPAANQQYRVASMRAAWGESAAPTRGPVRGLRELSLVELSGDDSLKTALWVGRESWVSSRAESIRAEIAQRTALMVLPIVLMWMRWRALLVPRQRWYSALPLVVSAPATFALFYGLLSQSQALADVFFAPRWSGPWLALAVIVVSSTAVDRVRQRVARVVRTA